jgi:hypothetical protein
MRAVEVSEYAPQHIRLSIPPNVGVHENHLLQPTINFFKAKSAKSMEELFWL